MNKDHWYDGWFYDKLIAPNQDRLFEEIIDLIEKDSTIIDVGCGTGRFSFSVSGNCRSVLGIDLSKRNIERAVRNHSENPDRKISFRHSSVDEIIADGEEHFDYAVITYVIHEVDESERVNLLRKISLVADKIIIGDYLAPKPDGFWGFINELVEFAAGSKHYRNYKSYLGNGGIYDLAEKAELKISVDIKNKPSTSHLVVLKAE